MALRYIQRLSGYFAMAAAGLTLAACVSTSSLDDLGNASPTGSAFTQQLFRNYSFLARSFNGGGGSSSDSGGGILDQDFTLFGDDDDTSPLAEAFATKALIAAKGIEVDPEPSSDGESASARDRLIHALSEGKDRFPVDAARAQTDFDCWMLNSAVAAQRGAAEQCRASFGNLIARLEAELRPQVAPPPPPQPPTVASNFTVYFDFDSWTLTGEELTVLQQAIATARAGIFQSKTCSTARATAYRPFTGAPARDLRSVGTTRNPRASKLVAAIMRVRSLTTARVRSGGRRHRSDRASQPSA